MSAALHRDARPLDFVCLVELEPEAPGAEALARGAASARRAFPRTGCLVVDAQWHWQEGISECSTWHSVVGEMGAWAAAEALAGESFSPYETVPVRQQLLEDSESDRRWLATRVHHAVADGLSTVRWIHHQLSVASGSLSAVVETRKAEPPRLRTHPAAVRRNHFAFSGAAGRVWSPHRRYSGQRRLAVHSLEAPVLEAAVAGLAGIRVNDLLGSTVLEAARRFNRAHGANAENMGLWLPVNIREKAFDGFGNGSSRIRVYGRCAEGASTLERCVAFREQVDWAREHGEWHVDSESRILGWPGWLRDATLRTWLKRPWVDMGSLPFSHMERLGVGEDRNALPGVRSLAFVGLLHERFPVAIVVATLRRKTWVSLTWDPALWGEAEISEFKGLWDDTLAQGIEELASCAG